MAVHEANFLRNKSYLAATGSHFFIDVLNNGRIVLAALLAVSLGLTNAGVGLYLLLYNLGTSLSQPLFGWLADRYGARWLVLGGMGWVIFFFGLAAVVPDWPAMIALTVASLGSGAFHPGGTKVASQTSDVRRTQATAFFFTMGQIGLFVGPILAGIVIDAFGRQGYVVIPLLALTALLGGWRWLSDDVHGQVPGAAGAPVAAGAGAGMAGLWRILPLLAAIVFAYNTVSFSTQNFAPKLFAEWGYSASYVGWIAGLFMMGAAVGGFVGGSLADRIGGKRVIMMAMPAAVLPIYFYIPAADVWRFPLLFMAGFFAGMPHSIVVLMVQSLLPGRRALASGLTLGFMFFSGAVGSYALGIVADQIGLDVALQGSALLTLAAGALALFLPRHLGPVPAAA